MKVEVQVKEVNYGFVTIEVENEDEIYDRAQDAYFDGNVYWDNCDWDIKNWKKLEEKCVSRGIVSAPACANAGTWFF